MGGKYTEAQRKATDKWQKENYECFKLKFKKGDRQKAKAMAEAEGKSMNQFILDRIFN